MITRSLIPACLLGLISYTGEAADLSFTAGHVNESANASGGGIAIGVLTCGVKGGPSFIIGSRRELRCIFQGNPGDPEDRYGGEIQKLGLDLGLVRTARLGWTVVAPVRSMGPGALAGWYAGITAGATIGAGANANVLVGGSFNTFALQPLSVQGQTGLNAAFGVAAIELYPLSGEPRDLPLK